MYETAILLLSGPFRVIFETFGQYLRSTSLNVKRCLYVKFEPDLSKHILKSDPTHLKWMSSAAPHIYFEASSICKNVDVRLLLENQKPAKPPFLNFEAVFSNDEDRNVISSYLIENFGLNDVKIITIENALMPDNGGNREIDQDFIVHKTVCLGGTFDRLHNGHKVLLTEALLRATEKLVIGVSTGPTLRRKVLWELIEPIEKRIEHVSKFLKEVDPSLRYEVVPITDVYGPTITDPDMDCLIVTTETKVGGDKVNEERKRRGMNEMEIFVVDLVENTEHTVDEEEKLSSSTNRMHLLGIPVKHEKPTIRPGEAYLILFQGHIMSGKSAISCFFQDLGIPVLCCDKILEAVLKKDLNFKTSFTNKFPGDSLFGTNEDMDLKELMIKCLQNKEKNDWLAESYFPKLKSSLHQVLKVYSEQGTKAIIVEDSTIFEDSDLEIDIHEKWAAIFPTPDAVKLAKDQYGLTDNEANELSEHLENEKYVQSANIIFCNKWSVQSLKEQVNKSYSYIKSGQENA